MTRMMIKIGFGENATSTSSPRKPSTQSAGWSAATIRPPSSGTIGSRLNRWGREPGHPKRGRGPRHDPPSVEGDDRQQVEQVEEEAEEGERLQVVRAGRLA